MPPLHKLEELSGDQLEQLPDEIWTLRNLTHLNLRGNRLEQLSDGSGQLPDLTRLSLRQPIGKTLLKN